MNQSKSSLPVSKNSCFSEHLVSQASEVNSPAQNFSVVYFSISHLESDKPSPLFSSYDHAAEFAESVVDQYPKLHIERIGRDFLSEYAPDRLKLLCEIIGVTRGKYIVVQGGDDDSVNSRLISPVFQSHEQACAWRALSLPFYPHCKIAQHESELDELSRFDSKHIMAFSVVVGGDGERRCMSISSRYFVTEAQANETYESLVADYPGCQIAQQYFRFNNVDQYVDLLNHLFGQFVVIARDNSLAPRARLGERLHFQRGLSANVGDIVALGSGLDEIPSIAFYQEGDEYYAVDVAIARVRQ